MFDKKAKSCVKRIHLVNDGLTDCFHSFSFLNDQVSCHKNL